MGCRAVFLLGAFAWAQAPPPDRPDARTLIAQSAVAIKKYPSYRLESLVTVDMRGGSMDTHIEMPSSIAVRRPDRMRIESRSQAGTVTIVSDGEHTWFYLSALKKYVKRDAVGLPEGAVGNAGLMPKGLPDLEKSVRSMKITGEDVADVAGVKFPCWMVETTYGLILLPEQHLAIRGAVQLNWIRKSDGLSLQNTFRGEIDMAGVSEPVVMTQSTRTTALQLIPKLADSEFAFTPPANAKQADDWTLPGISKPDLEGKPAPEFKARAADGSAIDLRSLKGKVVVVQIGADGCAPCRRDLPALARLAAEFRDVAIIGVSVGAPPAAKLAFPVVAVEESDALLAALSVNSFPTTVLIDREGNIASYEAGARGEAALRAELAKLTR